MQRRQQHVRHRAAPSLRPHSAGPATTKKSTKPLLAPANSLASSPGDSPRLVDVRPTSAQPRLNHHRPAPRPERAKHILSAVAGAAARAAAHEATTFETLAAATRSQNPKRFWAAKQSHWAAKRARALADVAASNEEAAVRLQAVARGQLARRGVQPNEGAGRASPATVPLTPPPAHLSPSSPDLNPLYISRSVPQLGSLEPCADAASQGIAWSIASGDLEPHALPNIGSTP